MKKLPVIAWDSPDELHSIEQGVQRLVRAINELPGERRDSSISEMDRMESG